mgnify:CR=1 FL=1
MRYFPLFADLRGQRVLIACEAYDVTIQQLCQDQLAAEVTARATNSGMFTVIVGDGNNGIGGAGTRCEEKRRGVARGETEEREGAGADEEREDEEGDVLRGQARVEPEREHAAREHHVDLAAGQLELERHALALGRQEVTGTNLLARWTHDFAPASSLEGCALKSARHRKDDPGSTFAPASGLAGHDFLLDGAEDRAESATPSTYSALQRLRAAFQLQAAARDAHGDPIAPHDILGGLLADGLGVVALDMSDPANPVKTANLVTPAMLSPHESLLVNQERGLLVATLGNPGFNVGILDVYDIKSDCARPKLLNSFASSDA